MITQPTCLSTRCISDHFEIQGGTTVKYIFAGNLRVAQVKGSTRTYFHKDHLGSSTVMTNASGVEIETTEYMPFGSQRNHSGTNTSAYKFTDQELDGGDGESNLYNYNARLYDPFIGRFISPDTIVPDSYNPQALNRYSYCLNNPLIYTDPSGHQQMPFEAYAQLIEMMNTLCALFPSSAGLLSGSGTCFLTGFDVGASLTGLGLWNSGFEDINAHQQWKAEQKLNEKVKEYAANEKLHWENKKQGGCGARAGWIKDDLTAEGYDTSYIYVKNTSFTAKNNFNYHVAVKVSSYGKEYVIDPYFWKGRRETLTTEYWLKKVDYSGKSGEYLDVARADNPLWDPDPSGGVTDFPKTWTDPPPKGYGYKNYSYKSTKDFYEIYLRGGHLQ